MEDWKYKDITVSLSGRMINALQTIAEYNCNKNGGTARSIEETAEDMLFRAICEKMDRIMEEEKSI